LLSRDVFVDKFRGLSQLPWYHFGMIFQVCSLALSGPSTNLTLRSASLVSKSPVTSVLRDCTGHSARFRALPVLLLVCPIHPYTPLPPRPPSSANDLFRISISWAHPAITSSVAALHPLVGVLLFCRAPLGITFLISR